MLPGQEFSAKRRQALEDFVVVLQKFLAQSGFYTQMLFNLLRIWAFHNDCV